MSPGGGALLPAVDRTAFAVALGDRLRARGVPVGLTLVDDFVRALVCTTLRSRAELYWTARICLVRNHDDLAEFDAVFEAVFGSAVLPLDPHARRDGPGAAPRGDDNHAPVPGSSREEEAGQGLPWVTRPTTVDAADGATEHTLALPERLPSDVAGLVDTPFEKLGPYETRLLGKWLESALRTWPTRRSRRFAVRQRGARIAVRATVERSRRTGWEPVVLVRNGAIAQPRRVVMLCDVSRSMQPQAVAYLHLMRALTLTADAQVFAFATSLTRLTTVLAQRSAEAAIEEASRRVADRFGGTRIAGSLRALLDSHHGGLLRGAVVVVGSDCWDGDPPERLAAAMARLRRRAHRVIWLNPRAGAPGFAPRTTTMAAALPYCDALVPGDTFASLRGLITQITHCARRERHPAPRM
ncbi:vWA domain-containing protein [Streptomyces sulphureus]|uniref:vWA domain-containing protein n=1 Tax=Streptomyces sulphureus TaxID=47758 RepID=UPI0003763C84|nr:VWA domain-containing protein [Streptomyces sulphureus]